MKSVTRGPDLAWMSLTIGARDGEQSRPWGRYADAPSAVVVGTTVTLVVIRERCVVKVQ